MEHSTFDLTNPQHVAMRKLMADVLSHFSNAVQEKNFDAAKRYQGMATGLCNVAVFVLRDFVLGQLAAELEHYLFNLMNFYQDMELAA